MSKSEYLLSLDTEKIDNLIKRALLNTHDTDTSDDVWMELSRAWKNISNGFDESELRTLGSIKEPNISDEMIHQLANELIYIVWEASSFDMSEEDISTRQNIVYESFKRYRDALNKNLFGFIDTRISELSLRRRRETGKYTLGDLDSIRLVLVFLHKKISRKMFLERDTPHKKLLLPVILKETQDCISDVDKVAYKIVKDLVGEVDTDSGEGKKFYEMIKTWLLKENTQESIENLRSEYNEMQIKLETGERRI